MGQDKRDINIIAKIGKGYDIIIPKPSFEAYRASPEKKARCKNDYYCNLAAMEKRMDNRRKLVAKIMEKIMET